MREGYRSGILQGQKGRGEEMRTKAGTGEQTRDRIFQAILDYMFANNYPPSTRDIMELTGIKSTSTVNWHLDIMQKQGRIDQKLSQPRTITVPGISYRRENT